MAIYFDNSATTKPCSEAVSAVNEALCECYGNPSSIHFLGTRANDLLRLSRSRVADAIGCEDNNLYFTSSGTLSNNTAVFGVCERLRREGNRIVTTALEHPSVLQPVKKLAETYGFEVIYLTPDKNGRITKEMLFEAVNSNTVLVSMMAVNNETGLILPVTDIKSAVRRANAPAVIHSDCVQAFGKIKISPKALGADIITISSHKIHGPKGAGALYISKKNILKPFVLGGGQESEMFSGTEAMPAIAGFGAAAAALPDISDELLYISSLKNHLLGALSVCDKFVINSPDDALPYIVNVSLLGMPSQPIVNYLSEKGICVSAGSACKKGKRSNVLTSMGLDPRIIDSAIRISFSRFNTENEVEILAQELINLAKKI